MKSWHLASGDNWLGRLDEPELKFCISPLACGIGVSNPIGIISANMSALRVAYESYYLTVVNHYGQYRRRGEKITYN